jgi:hypothetical protein
VRRLERYVIPAQLPPITRHIPTVYPSFAGNRGGQRRCLMLNK